MQIPINMGATKAKEEKKKPVLVPRKKLQTVPDLLANGAEGVPAEETTKEKMIWMAFVLILFFISFEIFLRIRRVDPDAKSEL